MIIIEFDQFELLNLFLILINIILLPALHKVWQTVKKLQGGYVYIAISTQHPKYLLLHNNAQSQLLLVNLQLTE